MKNILTEGPYRQTFHPRNNSFIFKNRPPPPPLQKNLRAPQAVCPFTRHTHGDHLRRASSSREIPRVANFVYIVTSLAAVCVRQSLVQYLANNKKFTKLFILHSFYLLWEKKKKLCGNTNVLNIALL